MTGKYAKVEDIIEELRAVLLAEKERARKEVLERERFRGEILGKKGEIVLLKLEKRVEPGTTLGYVEDDDAHTFGYVIAVLPGFAVVKRMSKKEPEEFVESENLSLFDAQIEFLDAFDPDILSPLHIDVERFKGSHIQPELDRWQNLAYSATKHLEDGQFLLVIGPPGTGKTRFISTASKLLGKEGKVLVTAHTNRAVDNIIKNLKPGFARRIGYKVSPEVRKHSIEHTLLELAESEETEESEVELKLKSSKTGGVDRIFEKLEKLSIDRITRKLLDEARVVGATLMKCALSHSFLPDFDYVFVDEASQATISEVLAGIFLGKKVILVGDPNQLPPVLRCRNPERFSAFSFFSLFTNKAVWLRTHYRSNAEIIGFSAKYVYGGKIKPHESCKEIKLRFRRSPKKYADVLDPEKPLVFLAVKGREERSGSSRLNIREAEVCCELFEELERSGVSDIAVITPYLAQKELIRSMGVDANTVDAFQGKESDVVIFSAVSTSSLRFSSDRKRFNVAVTRARRKLIVLANPLAFDFPSNRTTLLYRYYIHAKVRNSVFEV